MPGVRLIRAQCFLPEAPPPYPLIPNICVRGEIMARIAANVTELIGRTPLVRLNRVSAGLPATIVAKLDSQNPLPSGKDRIGFAMMEDAEKPGKIMREQTVLNGPP